MASNLYWLIVGSLFFFGIWAAVMFYKHPSWALAMLLPILVWFVFDPLVFALGNALGEGSTLHVLHSLRYLLKAIVTPFLLVIAFDQAKRAQVQWTDDPLLLLGLSIVILALLVIGVIQGFAGITLDPVILEGIKQYQPDTPIGWPLAAIATLAILMLLGWGVMVKTRAPWLLLGGVLLLVGVLGPIIFSLPSVIAAMTSVLFVLCLLLMEQKLQKIAPNPAIR